MQHATQLALTARILDHIDRGTTDRAAHVVPNPVSAYTCPERFARERAELFGARPLLAALSCQLAQPGDFLAEDESGLPVLLVRGNDGVARAFMNVCRHRGARIETDNAGCRQRFTCPYHAWTYDAQGQLAAVPNPDSFGDIDRAGHGLVPLPTVEWQGMIFVRYQPGGADFDVATLLGEPLASELAAYGLAGWHHYETRRFEQPMNWKGVIDTFLEGYHFGKLHRLSIAPIFFDNLTLYDGFGPHVRMVGARRTIERVRGREREEADLLRHMANVYVLFPNTVFVREGEQIEIWRVYPGATPDSARMVLSMYTPEPATTDSARRHWDNNMQLIVRTVFEEDFVVGRTMQANFHTGAQSHVVYGRNEPALAHFHRSLREALGEPEPDLPALASAG